MNRSRDNNRGQAYEAWVAERAKEVAEEQRLQQEAAANDPVAMAQRAMDAEAEAQRELVLHGRLSDRYMSDFGAVVREPFTEEQVQVAMNEFKAQTPDYIQTKANAAVLVEFIYRNNLSPGARTSYRLAHKILKLWNGYVDEVAPQIAQEVAPVVEAAPVLSRSEQAILDHQKYCEEIIGHDESGKGWTMRMVDALPSKEMLRLLRLFEQGHRGSNLLTIRREVLDIKQQQDAERARLAAEQEGGN